MLTYSAFIPQNVAPSGTRRIGIYNSKGNRVGFIPLGPLEFPEAGEKQYSFGALSDVHITYTTAEADLQKALIYLNETEDVAFICICGDLTANGTQEELARYKAVIDAYSPETAVYAISGNHETYDDGTADTEQLEPYTGQPLYYSFTHGNDVFIMVGCHSGTAGEIFTIEELQWLYETLEENRNKRCFVFEHVFPWGDSGNAMDAYAYGDLFAGEKGDVFKSLMQHYKNTVFFHGHSHMKYYLQGVDPKANYNESLGYRSVHISSLTVPRDIVNGVLTDIYGESEGYVVDVYEQGIHLRGRDFLNGTFLPIASYWLDTTTVNIPANTYEDTSGLIVTGEYRELEYVETTGTQYVDLKFVPNQDSRMVCECLYYSGNGVFGARNTVSSNNFSVRVISGKWQFGHGDGVVATNVQADTNWHTHDLASNKYYIDGVLIGEATYERFTCSYPVAVGAIRAGSIYYGNGRYKSCKVYDNGTLVVDVVAVRMRDGRVGMYDKTRDIFYGNAGTGEFVAGPGL